MSYEFIQSGAQSDCRRYVRATRPLRRVLETQRFVEKLNDEVGSKYVSATRGVLSFTHSDNKLLSRADDRDVLLYIEASGAQARGGKQKAAFNGRAFYLHAAALLQELIDMQKTPC